MFYNKIFGDDEKSIKLINRGLLDKLQDLSRSGNLTQALDTQTIRNGNLIIKFRNLGEIIVIVTSNGEVTTKTIDKISWELLRFIGNYQLTSLFEDNFNFKELEKILNEISSDLLNGGLSTNKKKLSAVSLIDIPIKYRNLALHVLSNHNFTPEVTQEAAEKFKLSLHELQNGIKYLKDEEYF